jgi:hypothetical protein
MTFRFRAFGLHVLGSATVLTLVLGALYLGWYRWPGWYLTGALKVAPMLVGIDLMLGPLFTLLIASPAKPRAILARDIAVIVAVQLGALAYGASVLWKGRPLYYAFSEDRLQIVQASEFAAGEIALARQSNPQFAPHWYSRPRWVWAPLPEAPAERARIIASARAGGDDVIDMPRYFRSWDEGLPALRAQLRTVAQQDDIRFYKKQALLAQRMLRRGYPPEQPVTLMLSGRGVPLLAVFDPQTLRIRAFLRADL